jgi:signal peptidase I
MGWRRLRGPSHAPARLRYLVLLLIVVCAASAGFVSGRAFERELPGGDTASIPGIQDYQALTLFNGYSIVRANGSSMQPSLARYNFLLVKDTRSVKRGDILVSRHYGIHRVFGLPGETISLVDGRVSVCSPLPGGPPNCRFKADPWVRYPSVPHHDAGPILLRDGYGTVPDNRSCCEFLIDVPSADVVGIVAGSLLSYGPLGPRDKPAPSRPSTTTLVYDPVLTATAVTHRRP